MADDLAGIRSQVLELQTKLNLLALHNANLLVLLETVLQQNKLNSPIVINNEHPTKPTLILDRMWDHVFNDIVTLSEEELAKAD